MSEPTPSSPAASRCEYTWAFLILRLFLGLRTFFEGVEKFEKGGTYSFKNYYENMGRMAQGITGASFLLLGVKTRTTLILTGLLYVSLSFGLMAVQENEGVAWLGVYIGLFAGALALVRHNRFVLWRDRCD
jgi:thiosulfate dehydrogenase [quinone] large subunit